MHRGRRSLTRLVCAAALLTSVGCKTPEEATVAPVAATPSSDEAATSGDETRAPVEMIRWQLGVEQIDDLLAQLETLIFQIQGADGPKLKLRPLVESLLAQRGVPAAVTQQLDWSGRWTVHAGYPQPGQEHARPGDLEFVGKFASSDPNALLSALPAPWTMQADEGGVTQITHQERPELSFAARGDGGQLIVARDPSQLDSAAALDGRPLPARVSLRSDNMHVGDIDPAQLLPLPAALAKPIGQALRSASSAEALLDLRRESGLRVHLQASADLSRFGFDFLGAAQTGPSELAARLPPGAALLISMSWGSPKLIHEELDRMTQRVPAPFDAWIADVLSGAHATLDVVRDEVIVGLYFDDKGRASLIVAGAVKDQTKANAAVRKVLGGAHAIAEKYQGLVGDDRDYRFKSEFQPEGLGFSKAKVDLLSVTVPKAMLEDAKRLAMFLGTDKPKLEVLSHIDEKYGLVAFGAGARGVMSSWVRTLGKKREQSAESEGGLALARSTGSGASSGAGCQLCVAVEPTRALQMWLTHERDFAQVDGADARVQDAAKLTNQGPVAFGLRASNREVALGAAASGSVLFAEPSVIASIMRLGQLLPERLEDAAPLGR